MLDCSILVPKAGRASGFKDVQKDDKKSNRVRMYQVKGTNELNTRAVEVRQIMMFKGIVQ